MKGRAVSTIEDTEVMSPVIGSCQSLPPTFSLFWLHTYFKTASVFPVFKKNSIDNTSLVDYRPISKLPLIVVGVGAHQLLQLLGNTISLININLASVENSN